MSTIESVSAFEILDSRGRPTLLARCALTSGIVAAASVPSGASTGIAEALELRDGDPRRFGGLGCRTAVSHVNHDINGALAGQSFATQQALDAFLIALDGTPNKARLGANAILGVSLAFCRAQAAESGRELFEHFAAIMDGVPRIPRLMINLLSGGKHGGQQIAIQDVQIVVPSAPSTMRALEVMSDVFNAAAALFAYKYGMRLLTADEGGLAPPVRSSTEMFNDAAMAIERAGYRPGEDVFLTVDVAASHFYENGIYHIDGERLSRTDMVRLVESWYERYPILSVEDGLSESDWAGWSQLTERIGQRVMVLGDDLLCTNPGRIQQAIDTHAANSLLLKVNQIGTLTEAARAHQLARDAGWRVVISARSGETEDNWLADLAVGWAGDYIKVGSVTQSERLAKYNRLLVIERSSQISRA
jgi:enolase